MPPKTLADWLRHAQSVHSQNIALGLDRVDAVRAAMDLTLPMPVVLVGGTNGKGSVCAFAEAALAEGGLVPGCFASPHLLRFNERMRVGGIPAPDDDIAAAYARVEAARRRAGQALTYFEFSALAAADIFARRRCDCAIMEVGLGGRLDAVNIFPPAVSVVTNIGTDHVEFLGPTRAHIAREKAGILRPGVPAVFGDDDLPDELIQQAQNIGAVVRRFGRDFAARPVSSEAWRFDGKRKLPDLPAPLMRGAHQLKNAATAVAALEELPGELWPGATGIRRGLRTAALPGRAQILPGRPTTVVDVAHNREAAAALERLLFHQGFFPRTAAIVGMFARKDAGAFVRALTKRVDLWIAAQPADGDRPAEQLAEAIRREGGEAECAPSTAAAFARARAFCGEDGRIVVAGSFPMAADFMQAQALGV